jgi:hypothetical protein
LTKLYALYTFGDTITTVDGLKTTPTVMELETNIYSENYMSDHDRVKATVAEEAGRVNIKQF